MAIDRRRVLRPIHKLRKLIGNLDSEAAPEAVHKLRTSMRRVEAVCEALFSDARGIRKSAIKDLRHCRRCAGKVRDMDVLTAHASTVHVAGEEECTVRLLEHLGARRQKYARKLYDAVQPIRSGLRKELNHLAGSVTGLIPANGAAANAAAAAVSLAVRLNEPHRLHRGNLHPYRLKVKKLRSVLLIAPGDTRLVNDLAKATDAIGEWHDWEDLVSIAEKELDPHGTGCGLLAELKRISRARYDHALAVALALRKTYLRSSGPQKGPSPAASSGIPRISVWDAIARLAV